MEQNNNTSLPAEVVEQISGDAIKRFPCTPISEKHIDNIERYRIGYEAGATEWAQWKVQYDELKERADKMAKEHSDLNLALAAMLNGYQNLSMYQKDWFTVPKDLIDAYTKMVIEYDNQGKEVENGL
jgi:hypothetical protein